MNHDAKFQGSRAIAFSLFFFLVGLISDMSAPSLPRAQRPEHVTATVRVIDPAARTLELITGVGHSFRLMRIDVAPDCEIRVPGKAPRLASLKPGVCVRVEYVTAPGVAEAPARKLAVAIEELAMDEAEGAR